MPALLLLALLLLPVPSPASAAWRWPVRGAVVTPFHLAPNPFAPGQHRGIDIAAAAGAPVRSACPGHVRFAGRLPGRGRVVSVGCGRLVATYLELATTAVRRGAAVGVGARIGTVAASHLQLGARRTGRPNAYVDPLTLLADRAPPPLGAVPRAGRGRRSPPPARLPAPAPLRVPGPAQATTTVPHPTTIPVAAWIGLALVVGGTPLGALAHRRRRARRHVLGVADEGA